MTETPVYWVHSHMQNMQNQENSANMLKHDKKLHHCSRIYTKCNIPADWWLFFFFFFLSTSQLHSLQMHHKRKKNSLFHLFFFSLLLLFLICLPSASHTPYMGKELVARTRAETRRGGRWVIYRKKKTPPKKKKKSSVCSLHTDGDINTKSLLLHFTRWDTRYCCII